MQIASLRDKVMSYEKNQRQNFQDISIFLTVIQIAGDQQNMIKWCFRERSSAIRSVKI